MSAKTVSERDRIARMIDHHNRRAAKYGVAGTFTVDEWLNLCVAYEHKCPACGSTTEQLTADHIIPLSRKGTNDIGNIQPLCRSCNSSKNTNTKRHFPKNPALAPQIRWLPYVAGGWGSAEEWEAKEDAYIIAEWVKQALGIVSIPLRLGTTKYHLFTDDRASSKEALRTVGLVKEN